MEGALGTVVAGLVENPVIAVPTSVGYGASFHGLSALITMINSCANGISVVNIDNGYGSSIPGGADQPPGGAGAEEDGRVIVVCDNCIKTKNGNVSIK